MHILTPANVPVEAATAAASAAAAGAGEGFVERFCILDYTDPADVDFVFPPLLSLDRFQAPEAVLRIGPHRLSMPLGWHLVVADRHGGQMEAVALSDVGRGGFEAYCLNPISAFAPECLPAAVERLLPERKWAAPRTRKGHLLAVPLGDGPRPPCALFATCVKRLPDALDVSAVFA